MLQIPEVNSEPWRESGKLNGCSSQTFGQDRRGFSLNLEGWLTAFGQLLDQRRVIN